MRRTVVMAVCGIVLALAMASSAGFAQEQRISLELKDADIQSALTMLFKDTGKSFVLEAGVQGDVNVSLRDVPWDQALRATLESANLTWVREDDIYRIRPATTTLPAPPPAAQVEQPTLSSVSVSRAPTAEGAIYLAIVPVRHASLLDMASWFGGSAVSGGGVSGQGASRYGIGSYGQVSGGGGFGTTGTVRGAGAISGAGAVTGGVSGAGSTLMGRLGGRD